MDYLTLVYCKYIMIVIIYNVAFCWRWLNLLRKIILIVATMLMAATSVFAAIDENAAKTIPAAAKHLYTKSGSMEYEIQFINENTNTHYDIKVSRATGTITESKTRVRGNSGSNNVQISEQQARNILLMDYPRAIISSTKLETDNGYKRYRLNFSAGNVVGVYEINPETGVVIEKDLKY